MSTTITEKTHLQQLYWTYWASSGTPARFKEHPSIKNTQTRYQSRMIPPKRSQTTEVKAGYTASKRPPCTRSYVTDQEGSKDEGTTTSSLYLSTFIREKRETLPFLRSSDLRS
ncbi:unnamed protein product [Brassica napus]|uniref:(rape) hypothetical protein n=1 Tax=Brassica napus TaxID=3708 RepID=A0A816Z1X2_BRANA|nr:unnamed protein product [Brassica napus]